MSTSPAKHFLTLLDLTREELDGLLDLADRLKFERGTHEKPLAGKTVAIVLEKASTRTRLSFEVGAHELGAMPTTLIAQHTQMGRGEPLTDTAKMFSRFVHAVVYRTHGHEKVVELASAATIPIINGLSDSVHPCQLLADLMTIREHRGAIDGERVAWIGDGNNMAHSYLYAAARYAIDLRLACPDGYDPDPAIVARARELGANVTLTRDPNEAAAGATVVTTDVFTSMGQEDEAATRLEAFSGFQVDDQLMARADEDAVFLHCLPAHRGEEVSASVLEGNASRVFDQAENRLHAQKALLVTLLC